MNASRTIDGFFISNLSIGGHRSRYWSAAAPVRIRVDRACGSSCLRAGRPSVIDVTGCIGCLQIRLCSQGGVLGRVGSKLYLNSGDELFPFLAVAAPAECLQVTVLRVPSPA